MKGIRIPPDYDPVARLAVVEHEVARCTGEVRGKAILVVAGRTVFIEQGASVRVTGQRRVYRARVLEDGRRCFFGAQRGQPQRKQKQTARKDKKAHSVFLSTIGVACFDVDGVIAHRVGIALLVLEVLLATDHLVLGRQSNGIIRGRTLEDEMDRLVG